MIIALFEFKSLRSSMFNVLHQIISNLNMLRTMKKEGYQYIPNELILEVQLEAVNANNAHHVFNSRFQLTEKWSKEGLEVQ